jgi:hypothetical protein
MKTNTDIWWWAIGALLLVIVVLILECQNMAEKIDDLDQQLTPHGAAYPGFRPPEE